MHGIMMNVIQRGPEMPLGLDPSLETVVPDLTASTVVLNIPTE
jgi:hypothetical protein